MMNEESDKQIESGAPSGKPLPKTSDRRTVPLVAVAAIAIVGIVAIAAWLNPSVRAIDSNARAC